MTTPIPTAAPTIAIQLNARRRRDLRRRRRSSPNRRASALIDSSLSRIQLPSKPCIGSSETGLASIPGADNCPCAASLTIDAAGVARDDVLGASELLRGIPDRLGRAWVQKVTRRAASKSPGTTRTHGRHRARTMTAPRIGAPASSDRGVARVAQWQSSALVMRRSWVRIPPRAPRECAASVDLQRSEFG